jgi:hypothetical protein
MGTATNVPCGAWTERYSHSNTQATGLKALIFTGDDQDINLFADKARGEALPGLPKLNYKRVASSTQMFVLIYIHNFAGACNDEH